MRIIFFSFILCFFLASGIIAEVDKNISKPVTNTTNVAKVNIIKNGKKIPLDKFKGSVLVFYFFNEDMDSWIRPIKTLNFLTKSFEDKKVKVGGFTTKSKEQINKQMKKIDFISFVKNIDFPIATKSKSAELLNIKTPVVYVTDLNGEIRWNGKLSQKLSDVISGLLSEKAPIATEKDNNLPGKWIADLNGLFVQFDSSVPPPPPDELMNGISVPRIERDIQGITARRKKEKAEKPKILDNKQRINSLPPARNNSLNDK